MSAAECRTVRKRAVFFISGFDPKGAAYYHRLYRTEAPRQGLANGWRYAVGPRVKLGEGAQGWSVVATAPQMDGQPEASVSADVTYLVWDDIVRSQWPKGVWGVLTGSIKAYWSAISSGIALVKVWSKTRRTLLALAYPALFWLLTSLLAALGGWWLAQGVGGVFGLAWAGAVGVLAFRLEQRLHTSWLLRIYRFADRWARGQLPDLDRRLDDMARRVADRLLLGDASDTPDDEVLVVGYSVGSLLAADVVARVARRCHGAEAAMARLSVLTLAQCMPLLGLMPAAHAYRGVLAAARSAGTPWVDFSAPTDWGSFALTDPFGICLGGDGVPRQHAYLSPRFHTLFDAAAYESLKNDKRRLHLQYLRSAPIGGGYDYFLMTAGPRALWDGVSRWRIEA